MKKRRAKHARLGCSSSERWLTCPASVAASQGLPRRSSTAAEEGTLAHNVLELCYLLDIDPFTVDKYEGQDIPEDMQRAVARAIAAANRWLADHPNGKVYVEHELEPGKLIGLTDLYGTADLVLIDETPGNEEVCVIDLKYGRKKVVAKGNPQLKLYAGGALYEFIAPQRRAGMRVRLIIVQPRVSDMDGEWETNGADLLAWMKKEVLKAAEASHDANGPRTPGDHCFFCPVNQNGSCHALVSEAFRVAGLDFAPEEDVLGDQAPVPISEMDPEEIEYAMAYADMIEGWLSNLRASAQRLILSGYDMAGQKIVYKTKHRKYSDEADLAITRELSGKIDIDTFAPRKLLAVGEMAKLLRRHKVKLDLTPYIREPEPEITVAPASDNRKTVDPSCYGQFVDKE